MLKCLLVGDMSSGICFKIILVGRGQVMIKGIDGIRLAVNWLLKLGDGYVGAHYTGFSNKYLRLSVIKSRNFY